MFAQLLHYEIGHMHKGYLISFCSHLWLVHYNQWSNEVNQLVILHKRKNRLNRPNLRIFNVLISNVQSSAPVLLSLHIWAGWTLFTIILDSLEKLNQEKINPVQYFLNSAQWFDALLAYKISRHLCGNQRLEIRYRNGWWKEKTI